MRAVVVDGAGAPRVADVPEPDAPGELVRVRACGLCGSDLEKLRPAHAGTVVGHEVVADTSDGRRVVLVHHWPCGECERCRAGHESTCAAFGRPTIRPETSRGVETGLVRVQGGTRTKLVLYRSDVDDLIAERASQPDHAPLARWHRAACAAA